MNIVTPDKTIKERFEEAVAKEKHRRTNKVKERAGRWLNDQGFELIQGDEKASWYAVPTTPEMKFTVKLTCSSVCVETPVHIDEICYSTKEDPFGTVIELIKERADFALTSDPYLRGEDCENSTYNPENEAASGEKKNCADYARERGLV